MSGRLRVASHWSKPFGKSLHSGFHRRWAPTLDPGALPEIHAELVASTELTWDPRTDWDPGADVVISAEGDLFVSQVGDRKMNWAGLLWFATGWGGESG